MGEEPLTRPENCADLRARRRVGQIVVAAGGCPHCTKRVEGRGQMGCGVSSVFPLCTKGHRPKFELDDETIREKFHGPG